MTIYQIDQRIDELLNAIDLETGEALFDIAEIEALNMERERKVENLALAVKNYRAEAAAIKAEEDALAERRKSKEGAADRAEKYLEFVLGGEDFQSAKVEVKHKTSKVIKIADGFVEWAKEYGKKFLRYKEPEADKTAIRNAIKAGEKVEFASIETNTTMKVR